MSVCIAFSLLLFLTFLHCMVSSDLSNRIVFTTSREDDPDTWFDNENPPFEYIGLLDVGETRFIKARIRQTDTKKKISSFREDQDVEILRQKPEILWIKQEKFKARKTRTSDPEWHNLWYMNGEVPPSMNVLEAWNRGYSGKGVVIAVVDTGLQTDHPDISANIDVFNSVQIRDGIITNDPNPKYPSDRHGTLVAGLIAAVKDNNICIPGVAYNSTIIGVQLLSFKPKESENISDYDYDYGGFEFKQDTAATRIIENIVDSDEASALQHQKSIVNIYSNSWGPKDGSGFIGPEKLTKDVLRNGVTEGRNRKGVIYVISAGNGGIDDNCNADGYANSRYTIAITSVQTGRNANYAEVCAAALAATYGGSHEDRYLTTTDIDSGCTSDGISGTSYSAPIASGIIAMTLEANTDLTWRDIQHLIVLTSNRYTLNDTFSGWLINGAYLEYSQILGFGLMNAEAMVSIGSMWKPVPQQYSCKSAFQYPKTGSTTSTTSHSLNIAASKCPTIKYLEHVEVTVTFSYSNYRGYTELYLISPAGTKSNILHYRPKDAQDNQNAGSLTWTYMSVHFWGETPLGSWTLQIGSKFSFVKVTLIEWSLVLYGTPTDPWHMAIYRVVFAIETSAYHSSDNVALNKPSSNEFKDIQAGLKRYWLKKVGTGFGCLVIIKFSQTGKASIVVDQKVYIRKLRTAYLVKACYDLVNGIESLRFGSISSLKASTASIMKDNKPSTKVVISKLTELTDLCDIRSTLSPCSSSQECQISNGKPLCVLRTSTSTVFSKSTSAVFMKITSTDKPKAQKPTNDHRGPIIGGILGGLALLAVGGGGYAVFRKRQQK